MTLPEPSATERTFTGQVVLGRYHVVLPLGRGGMGEVHLARAEGAAGVARPVVIKRVLGPFARDKETRARFIREARITARLRHPDIVSIVEFERESDDSYLMVLEYVHGYDLWRWARFVQATRGQVPARLLAYVGTRVLDALHYSHSLRNPDGTPSPVIHRDVSAGNVLIDVTGQIKLSDFGIAAVLAKGGEGEAIDQGLQGKLGYIAPELFAGEQASPASDIYACGVMLHSLLGGKNEFQAIDVHSAEARARSHVPTPLDSVRNDVSPAVAEVIARALAKDPRARFSSAAAFASDLRRAFALDLAEVRDEFARAVERDFEDPLFAETMKVLSLREIDAAWRTQDGDAPSDSLKPSRASLPSLFPPAPSHEATRPVRAKAPLPSNDVAAEQTALAPRAYARASKLELLIWSTAVAVLVALLIVLVVVRLRPSGDERVVYVEAQATAAPVAQAAPPLASETAQVEAPSVVEPARGKTAPKVPARKLDDPGNQLTGHFAQRRAEVSACFQKQSEPAPAQLSIAFEVDPQGRVERAELDPESLNDSALGRCLLAIARSTRFGPQLGYLRFRIPVNARMHKAP